MAEGEPTIRCDVCDAALDASVLGDGLTICPYVREDCPNREGVQWAVLEIMGFRKHVGMISEVEQFGVKQARIDVPIFMLDAAGKPVFQRWETHYYGGQAIFGMTPTNAELALRAAKRDAGAMPAQLTRLPPRPEDDPYEDQDEEAP